MKPETALLEVDVATVQEALSFREPRRVEKILRLPNGQCFPLCPKCQVSLEREYSRFCDRCGQRLSWTGFWKAKVISIDTIK